MFRVVMRLSTADTRVSTRVGEARSLRTHRRWYEEWPNYATYCARFEFALSRGWTDIPRRKSGVYKRIRELFLVFPIVCYKSEYR